jgi:hypothetical protein
LDGIVEGRGRGKGVKRTLSAVVVMNMKSGEKERTSTDALSHRFPTLTATSNSNHTKQLRSGLTDTRFCPNPCRSYTYPNHYQLVLTHIQPDSFAIDQHQLTHGRLRTLPEQSHDGGGSNINVPGWLIATMTP